VLRAIDFVGFTNFNGLFLREEGETVSIIISIVRMMTVHVYDSANQTYTQISEQ